MSRFHLFLLLISILVSLCLSVPLFAEAQTAGCDQSRDPHSFACADDTFASHVFPMLPMNPQVIQGPWTLVTFAEAPTAQPAPFVFVKNAQNPRIPLGVFNQRDRSAAGPLLWQPGQIQFANWTQANQTVLEIPGRTKFTDPFTVEMRLNAFGAVEGIQCRLFNRVNTPHLLCRWFTLEQTQFVLRGYFGFLKAGANGAPAQ